ncbi:Transcriptional regulator, LysR family [Pseudonocardia sp. Ae168_Ps1]|uniref:LysR family transcriptional regulator n=1 Tax=unclassified Pseudonocardia TaxID=2619320 RepID=UPI00094B4D10|nr:MULTISPECIES: LysR substrate-binding domain-containing protein [unclassified Pseudonocardia]OLL72147.1 Transcriptional regulator, LysR family [Pseudonocardia sp. Ae150A_Ps1]OLL78114.1 Transcriptional regulator, LysR family [Pseudonocardia sp. Ae168_Ps1]OLL87762.1 Transcriptional regulator, LysR family [Pseudonocardia sp. Ae263_Ps1]OLL92212.1 Transcriptional regulator, LysR family [Pseudonocardia sp. Ae356_Ps1]
MDPVLLRSFAAVARMRSFTRAATALGLGQSTVSQHVRKLEAVVGRPLLDRDAHSVALTADGEAMQEFAATILDAGDRALAHFRSARVHGRVRFGVSEDLVLTRLPAILADFRRRYPEVELRLTVGLADSLERRLDRGELDLIFAKRAPGADGDPAVVRHDRFVWVGPPGCGIGPDDPVPLLGYPPPSLSRSAAVGALEAAGRPWRMVCTSGSLSGLRAAALAGLGVLAHAGTLVPDGLEKVPARAGLPALGPVEVVLVHGRRRTGPAEALAHSIRTAAADLRSGA